MNDSAAAPPPLRDRLEAMGQGHLWAHAQDLSLAERGRFLEAAAAQPWEVLSEALDGAKASTA